MSKYRIELAPSQYKFFVLLLFWGLVLASICHWQSNIMPYQPVIQFLFAGIILWFAFTSLLACKKTLPRLIALSVQGEWDDLEQDNPSQWRMSGKSRVTPWLLWVHLISPIDAKTAQWVFVYKDQVSEADYRRLCRVILLLQQKKSQ
ncbi:protein YgfX [Flavobacterium sp. W21_SRS_FM6]|uniref:protein YgfX n=1 Tax=Flavobacterium sp. W21_SRS_FM6 TaxID=3240268 RepID=UPI003F8E421C